MASVITTASQIIDVTDIVQIVVTDIVDDGTSSGTSIRAIRIMGTPVVNSAPTLLLELRLRSQTPADLDIQAPAFSF